MLAKQLTFLANADSAGLVLGARVPVDPHQPRRQCPVANRELCRGDARCSRAAARSRRLSGAAEGAWNDYALVLNAGSSSLKFCVYQRPANEVELAPRIPRPDRRRSGLRLECRRRMARAERLSTRSLGSVCATGGSRPRTRCAGWLRTYRRRASARRRAPRGARRPTSRHSPPSSRRTCWQNCTPWCRLLRFTSPTISPPSRLWRARCRDVPQVACFDTSFHRGQPAVAELVPLPQRDPASKECSAMGFTGCPTNTSRLSCRRSRPEIAEGRVIVAHLGSGASLCALKHRKSVDSSLGFTALDGICMGTRPAPSTPASSSICSRAWGFRRKRSRRFSTRNRVCLESPASAATCEPSSEDPKARLAVDYFVYQAAKEIGALAAVLGGIDGLVFTAGIGENSPKSDERICEASAWLGVNWMMKLTSRKSARASPAQGSGSRCG